MVESTPAYSSTVTSEHGYEKKVDRALQSEETRSPLF